MTRSLNISQKLLSLKERFQIADADGQVVYDCTWQWAWFNPPWTLSREGREVAVFRKKLWAWAPTWRVRIGGSEFQLRKKLLSLRRRLLVQGGPFDGAELSGSLLGLSFELRWRDTVLARAQERILTLRDRHHIELIDESPDVELLTAVLMACLLVQKKDEEAAQQAAA